MTMFDIGKLLSCMFQFDDREFHAENSGKNSEALSNKLIWRKRFEYEDTKVGALGADGKSGEFLFEDGLKPLHGKLK